MTKRYCAPCDSWRPAREYVCEACGAVTDKAEPEEPERDEAYERASAKYDGAHGEKDWR